MYLEVEKLCLNLIIESFNINFKHYFEVCFCTNYKCPIKSKRLSKLLNVLVLF